jgi:peptidoglycan/LPS O-acetylase OafA/YrhL
MDPGNAGWRKDELVWNDQHLNLLADCSDLELRILSPRMTTERISALDGLRGYAAVIVLVFHTMIGFDRGLVAILGPNIQALPRSDIWNKFWLTALNGESAVIIFFLLSGCVLAKSAAKDTERFGAIRSAVAFGARRALRVFPAVIVCVVATAGAMAVLRYFNYPADEISGRTILGNAFLLNHIVIGPTWSLQVEMAAVPFIFLGGWALSRFGYIGPVLFVLASLVVHELPGLVGKYATLSQFLLYMALGAVVPTEVGEGSSRVAQRIGGPALILGFVFIRMFLPFGPIGMLLQAAFGFLFLCLLVHVKPAKIGAFLNHPVSQFLGRVSFGFYLWNYFFLRILWGTQILYKQPIIVNYAVEMGFIIGIMLAVPSLYMAALSGRHVERPFIDIGRAISDRIFNRSASATPATA